MTAASGEYKSDLNTVEAIQNYLGVHEYQGHGVKGHSGGMKLGGTHWKAYRDQYKHSTYKGLTEGQQKEIKDRVFEYMAIENPTLYKQLIQNGKKK